MREEEALMSKASTGLFEGIVSSERESNFQHQDDLKIPLQDSERNHSSLMKDSENQISSHDKTSALRLWVEISVTCVLSLTGLAVGYIFGFTGIALPSMMKSANGTQVEDDLVLDIDEAAIFSSSVMFSSMFGSLLSAPLLVHFGQKTSLIAISIVTIVAIVVTSLARTFWLLLLSRLMLGVYPVVVGSSLCSYIAEIAHPIQRGRLLSMLDLIRQLGFLYVFVVGSTNLSWRNVNWVCGISSVIFPLLILPFLPDSPRWLMLQGEREKAKNALVFYRGKTYDTNLEISKIAEELDKLSKKPKGFLNQIKILGERSNLKRFLGLCYIHLALHFTGNFVMLTYAITMFKSTGTNINEYMSTILIGAVRFLGSLLYTFVADKVQRRKMMLFSLSVIFLCTILLGVFFWLGENNIKVPSLNWLPLVVCLVFNLSLCFSFPIILASRTEILPNSVRTLAISLLYFPFFLGAFTVALTYPYMADSIGSAWTFWVYSINTFILTLACYFIIPDTKGKTLEEINQSFQNKRKIEPI